MQVDGARNVDVLRRLRDDPELNFWYLADAAAADYGVGEYFEVVYHLYSNLHPAWLRVRARVDRSSPHLPTITGLWEGAMFHEREMFDMMGIIFDGNRDLRRIYMSPDYRSFPQRKDFLLPDDAADSSAAGVNPLERPETWDLSRFSEEVAHSITPLLPLGNGADRLQLGATAPGETEASEAQASEAQAETEARHTEAEAGETDADKSRPR